jgi:AraC-like DNA-binding protein
LNAGDIISKTRRMIFNAYIPTELLRPFIKTYLIVESLDVEANLVNKVMPDTSLVMSFRYKGQVKDGFGENKKKSLPSSAFSGLRKSVRIFSYSKNAGNILVLFKEARAAAFFKEPLHEIFDAIVSLDNFISHQSFSILEEQLVGAASNIQRIALIEKFLLSKLYDHKPDKLILTALQKIHSTNGAIKIKDLTGTLNISRDPFEKRFRRVVGTSPKQFSAIIRMGYIISSMQQEQTLTAIALDAGYFDQPHFNRDFKQFTGQTPTDFFKIPSFLQINDFLQ